jgi:hypothetical protein
MIGEECKGKASYDFLLEYKGIFDEVCFWR